MIRLWIGIMSLVAAVVCMAFPVHAADASFSWTPNTESKLAGYKIYYGTEAGKYSASVDQGLPADIDGKAYGAVTGLDAGVTYYFVATAYDDNGFESLPSNEVVWSTPVRLQAPGTFTAEAPSKTTITITVE